MGGVESEQHFRTVPESVQILRSLALAITALIPYIFRREVLRHPEDGLSRLQELAKQGYGSLILVNHFSKGDGPQAIATVFKDPVLGKRQILLPEAFHQYRKWQYLVGRSIGVTLCPIVTADTKKFIEDHPEKKPIAKHGPARQLREYIEKALDTLGSGGVVIMFPQGGRRPSLTEISNAVQTLLNQSNRAPIEKIAILFLGLGIKGVDDYQKKGIDGLNPFKTYQVTVGEAMTKEELLKEATKKNRTVNGVVLGKMREVVPTIYLPQTALKA